MVKASASKSWVVPQDFVELYSTTSAEQICQHLDLNADAPIIPRRDWRTYLFNEFGRFKQQADSLVTKYGRYLPESVCADIEEIVAGILFVWSRYLPSIHQVDMQENFQRFPAFGPGLEDLVAKDFQHILQLIEHIQPDLQRLGLSSPSFPRENLSRDDVSPHRGESRIEPPQKLPRYEH